MDHIWAPWRIEYVTRPRVEGCVLCHKARAADDVVEQVLFRDENCYVVLNAYPYNSGHVMVVPYEHVGDLSALAENVLAEMMGLAQACVRAMNECLRPDGVNLGMNLGKAAGAGIDEHLHLHVVPRWRGDTNFMTAIADVRVVPQALEESARLLAPLVAREASSRQRG